MVFDPGQEARSGAATLAHSNGGRSDANGKGADAAARDLLFIEQLKFGEAQLASETIFLCGLIHDSVATARRDAGERNIEIVVNRCDRVVSSRRGDRRRLIQAFDHLIRNATQYTPHGGRVEVRGMLLDRRFLIEVSDCGPGIPVEETQLVFDAFYRGSTAVQRNVNGRGIGLTVARAIIEAHSGSLRVGNNAETGTTAYVELPA